MASEGGSRCTRKSPDDCIALGCRMTVPRQPPGTAGYRRPYCYDPAAKRRAFQAHARRAYGAATQKWVDALVAATRLAEERCPAAAKKQLRAHVEKLRRDVGKLDRVLRRQLLDKGGAPPPSRLEERMRARFEKVAAALADKCGVKRGSIPWPHIDARFETTYRCNGQDMPDALARWLVADDQWKNKSVFCDATATVNLRGVAARVLGVEWRDEAAGAAGAAVASHPAFQEGQLLRDSYAVVHVRGQWVAVAQPKDEDDDPARPGFGAAAVARVVSILSYIMQHAARLGARMLQTLARAVRFALAQIFGALRRSAAPLLAVTMIVLIIVFIRTALRTGGASPVLVAFEAMCPADFDAEIVANALTIAQSSVVRIPWIVAQFILGKPLAIAVPQVAPPLPVFPEPGTAVEMTCELIGAVARNNNVTGNASAAVAAAQSAAAAAAAGNGDAGVRAFITYWMTTLYRAMGSIQAATVGGAVSAVAKRLFRGDLMTVREGLDWLNRVGFVPGARPRRPPDWFGR